MPNLHIPFPPSLIIILMVSVDIKYHVYLLTNLTSNYSKKGFMCTCNFTSCYCDICMTYGDVKGRSTLVSFNVEYIKVRRL